jgi:hypothetical protein
MTLRIAVGVGCLVPGCTTEIGEVACTEGVGAPPQVGCSAATLDCNCSADDGCEVDARSSATNCGRCGHDCLGGECVDGACVPVLLAELEAKAESLQLSAAGVFVAVTSEIVRVDPKTGAIATLTPTSEAPVFAVDAAHLYWASDGASLHRVPLGGGETEILAPVIEVGGLALDDSDVFFTDDTYVRSIPKTGGAVTDLVTVTNALVGVVVDDDSVFFFRGTTNGSLHRVAKSGAEPKVLIGSTEIDDIAIDELRVYITLRAEGPYGIDKTGTNGALLTRHPGARSIAVDATDVYFTTDDGSVLRVPKAGGEARLVAEGQGVVTDVAVDDTSVYWTRVADAGSAVMRVTK